MTKTQKRKEKRKENYPKNKIIYILWVTDPWPWGPRQWCVCKITHKYIVPLEQTVISLIKMYRYISLINIIDKSVWHFYAQKINK